MFVVGIDPSLRHTGLAIASIDEDRPNVVTPFDLRLVETVAADYPGRKSFDDLDCAGTLFGGIEGFLAEHAVGGGDAVVVEVPSGTQSARASWTLGIVLGIVAAVESRFPGAFVRVTPRQVKQHFTGNPTAVKETMIQTAVSRHPELPWLYRSKRLVAKNEHLADALAVLLCGADEPVVQEHLKSRSPR